MHDNVKEKVIKPALWFLAALLAIAIVITAILGSGELQNKVEPVTAAPLTSHITNQFADVNGDGAIDLIVFGEVVFNTPPLAGQ